MDASAPARIAKYYFQPNQIEGASWNALNGHIEGSFSDLSLWPNLVQHLIANGGGFGISAPEMPFTSDATLAAMRAKGLAISVDPPGFTQCARGATIADAELNGADNEIGRGFKIVGRGWFVTKDGTTFKPDEIALDEHQPVLTPHPSSPGQPVQDWCPIADRFNAPLSRVDGMVNDYIEYARAVKAKWPDGTPHVSFAWNVNTVFADQAQILDKLVKAMCERAMCPITVWMDVDWVAGTQQSAAVLTKYKALLARYGIGLGILLSGDPLDLNDDRYIADRDILTVVSHPKGTGNQLYQESQVSILRWLIRKGVVDANTRLRIVSWTHRPQESGSRVNESISFTLAHTANRLFKELLIPNGFAQ